MSVWYGVAMSKVLCSKHRNYSVWSYFIFLFILFLLIVSTKIYFYYYKRQTEKIKLNLIYLRRKQKSTQKLMGSKQYAFIDIYILFVVESSENN